MDWSKAKNIIIAALLLANLLIGVNLLVQNASEQRRERVLAENACAFLEQRGMQIRADMPDTDEKLPVLFLRIRRSDEEPQRAEYRGHEIVVQNSGIAFDIAGPGQQAAAIIPASDALLKLYAELCSEGDVAGKSIDAIDLVYLLTVDQATYAAQDTAVPSWRIVVSGEAHFVDAYGE